MQPSPYKIIKPISAGKLIEILSKYNYIIIRRGIFAPAQGINCKACIILIKHLKIDIKKPSQVFSWYPCDLNEYITYKLPFYILY